MNGVRTDPSQAAISVFDVGFQRGYGCFEAIRSYPAGLFRLDDHLARLQRSASHLRIELRDQSALRSWCIEAGSSSEGVLRIYVTGGMDASRPGTNNTIVVFLEPVPLRSPGVSLDLLQAPWHADGRASELTGAKTLSYGPNLAATIEAQSKGFDDAALIGSGDVVLEGPTFSLGWIRNGVVYTPSLDSHILASITREATLEVAARIGLDVSIGRFERSDLLQADEVFVMSTVREVMPVTAVGDVDFGQGPVTSQLVDGFQELVARELA